MPPIPEGLTQARWLWIRLITSCQPIRFIYHPPSYPADRQQIRIYEPQDFHRAGMATPRYWPSPHHPCTARRLWIHMDDYGAVGGGPALLPRDVGGDWSRLHCPCQGMPAHPGRRPRPLR